MDVLHVSAARSLLRVPLTSDFNAYREGNARITLFAANGNARTFDYQGGDIAYVPASYGLHRLL